jgi:hypothetical protein
MYLFMLNFPEKHPLGNAFFVNQLEDHLLGSVLSFSIIPAFREHTVV